MTIGLASNGTGTSGLGTTSLGSQSLTATGTVYRLAGANTLGTINFGNHHLGDTVRTVLSLQNTATNDGYSEGLDANFGGVALGLTSSGSVGVLAASSTSTAMSLALSTTSVAQEAATSP